MSVDIAQHDCALVNEMRKLRDAEARCSAGFLEVCNAPSFGSTSADTNMSVTALALQHDFPDDEGAHVREQLDKQIYSRLLLLTAQAASRHFRSTLGRLFADAQIQEGHHPRLPMPPRSSSLAMSFDYDDSNDHHALTIAIAPVKGLERTLIKFEEYSADNEANQWPVTPQIRDTLRAKILAPDGDSFANAANAIISAFDVRVGNGRFKNNLMAEKHQPPNLLINFVVRPPGMSPITAEVQIYLCGIEELTEHRYYEVWPFLFSVSLCGCVGTRHDSPAVRTLFASDHSSAFSASTPR